MTFRKAVTSGVLAALASFCRRDVVPRITEIVLTQDFVISFLLGVGLAVWGPSRLTGAPRLADFAMGYLAYAAIALGFCVAGMTITLTLPDRPFLEKLAKLEIKGRAGNGLTSLLFVFTWTAILHWFAIVALILALTLDGGSTQSFAAKVTLPRRMLMAAISFVCSYALLQFLITVLTLAHVGRHFVSGLRPAGEALDAPSATAGSVGSGSSPQS